MIVRKPWGTMERVSKGDVETYNLTIVEGGKTSLHRHLCETNTIKCVTGKMLVYVVENDVRRSFEIDPGESVTIKPMVWHGFEAKLSSTAIEHYTGGLGEYTIERSAEPL